MRIKYIILFLFMVSFSAATIAQQNDEEKLYNPDADASEVLKQKLKIAQKTNKHVLMQIGGNWCPWCTRLHNFFRNNEDVDSVLRADYIFMPVNYSKENKNKDILKKYGYPHRFGFPVLVVLDEKGTRLHTQNTVLLEAGKGYNKKKVMEFLEGWTPEALNKNNYSF